METTNKRIAFYTAIIGTILSILLPALGLQITPEQQETLIKAMLLVCAAFGLSDVGYDWINAARGNFDVTISETSTTVTNPDTPVTTETKAVERSVSLASDTNVTTDVSLVG